MMSKPGENSYSDIELAFDGNIKRHVNGELRECVPIDVLVYTKFGNEIKSYNEDNSFEVLVPQLPRIGDKFIIPMKYPKRKKDREVEFSVINVELRWADIDDTSYPKGTLNMHYWVSICVDMPYYSDRADFEKADFPRAWYGRFTHDAG